VKDIILAVINAIGDMELKITGGFVLIAASLILLGFHSLIIKIIELIK